MGKLSLNLSNNDNDSKLSVSVNNIDVIGREDQCENYRPRHNVQGQTNVMGNYQNSASFSNISLNIFHQNLQSFRNKKDILEVLLHDELANVDVLGLTEHWLMADEIGYFKLPEYSLISSYCRTNKKNGGSCIYVKSNIAVKPITKFDYLNVVLYLYLFTSSSNPTNGYSTCHKLKNKSIKIHN
jgi:hypothetical protein